MSETKRIPKRDKHKPIVRGKALPRYENTTTMNVFDAAKERIRWLYSEFPEGVVVTNSGGKDSTVVVELTCQVAKEIGAGPVTVIWVDQECEFQSTVDYQRYLAYERDDIDFKWYQVPFEIDNATSSEDHWMHVWGEGEQWVREKEPNSIHENVYGQRFFYDLMRAIRSRDTGKLTAGVDGMRAEESPARRLTMTSSPMYKWVTWSAVDADPATEGDPETHRYRFHPIFDWSYRDVWKAIHDNGWRYNKHYDHLFRRGIAARNMRVSNYTHESAIPSLQWLQEVEPETWEAATRRLPGISTYGHLGKDQMPKKLPYMFVDWLEYANYLIDNLPTSEEDRATYRKQRDSLKFQAPEIDDNELGRVMARQVIGGDLWGTHIGNYMIEHRRKKRMGLI